jgi:hypothetical protein
MRFGVTHMFNLKRISSIMIDALTATECFFYNSLVYKEFIEEREEVLKHKWLESEKKGYDIGYSTALIDWILKHRTNWRNYRRNEK